MHSGNLTKEAFLPVDIMKDVKSEPANDYKLLYGNALQVPHYFKEKKNETKEQVFIRQQFKDQFVVLIDALKKWARENGYPENELETAEKFKTKLFDDHYSGNQTNEYFDAIKQFLEHIWFALNDKHTPHLRKKSAFDHLIQNAFSACSPGVYGHLENILFVLSADISLARWLAEMRTNLIRIYADQHIAKYNIPQGYWVHVHNAFMMYALNDKWAPISTIHKNNDPYLSNCRIDSNDITHFAHHLENNYTPKAIIDCFTSNFTNELRKLQQAKGFESKTDWFPYSSSFVDCADGLLKDLGLKIKANNMFDLNDEGTEIRFNPSSFKVALLNYFKESHRFFEKTILKVKKLKNDALYHYLDDGIGDVAWLENSEGNRFIETDLERYVVQLDPDPTKWSTQNKNKVRDLIQSKGEKLAQLLNLLNSHWQEIFNCLGTDYLKNMLSTVQEATNLIEKIPAEKRSELKPIISSVEDSLFLQGTKQKNSDFIKKLISEVKLNSRAAVEAAVECGDLQLIKNLMQEMKIDVNQVNKDRTLLSIAINQNNTSTEHQLTVLKYLIEECKADVNVQYNKKTLLLDAVQLGRMDAIKYIIPATTSHESKKEALQIATYHNHFEVVKWLVQNNSYDLSELTKAANVANFRDHYDILHWLAIEYPIRQILGKIQFNDPKDIFAVGDILENLMEGKPATPIKSKYARIISELCTCVAQVSCRENSIVVARTAENIIREYIENLKTQKTKYLINQVAIKPQSILKVIVKISPNDWPYHFKYVLKNRIKDVTALGKLMLALPNHESWPKLVTLLGEAHITNLLNSPGALEQFIQLFPKEKRLWLKPVLEMLGKDYLPSVLIPEQLSLLKTLIQDVKISKNEVLHYAASQGDINTIRFLIKEGVDVNTKNNNGETILHHAIRQGNLKLARYLVSEARADMYASSLQSGTILENAGFEAARWLVLKAGYQIRTHDVASIESRDWVKEIGNCIRKLDEAKIKQASDYDEFCFTFIKLLDPKIALPTTGKYLSIYNELLAMLDLHRSNPIIYNDMITVINRKIHGYATIPEYLKKTFIEFQKKIDQSVKRILRLDIDGTLEYKPLEYKPVAIKHIYNLFAPRNNGQQLQPQPEENKIDERIRLRM